MTELSYKQNMFVEAYLGDAKGNATQAARVAGYKFPNAQGARLLTNVSISARVCARVTELAMGTEEVLRRLGWHARGTIAHFIDDQGNLTLTSEAARENMDLVKRIKVRQIRTDQGTGTEIEIELYDAKDALVQLGRYHKLFTDKHDVEMGTQALEMLRKVLGATPDPEKNIQ